MKNRQRVKDWLQSVQVYSRKPRAPRLKHGQPSSGVPEPAYRTLPCELLPLAKVQGGLAMGTPSSLKPYPQAR